MQENQNNSAPEQSAQEMSEILRVRREKLEELKDSGKNPFEITRTWKAARFPLPGA